MTQEEKDQLFELREGLKKCDSGCAMDHLGLTKLEELLQLLIKEAI